MTSYNSESINPEECQEKQQQQQQRQQELQRESQNEALQELSALTPLVDFAVKFGRKVINVSIPINEPITNLKEKLQIETNVPMEKQRVLFNAPVVKTHRRSDATDKILIRDLFPSSLLDKLYKTSASTPSLESSKSNTEITTTSKTAMMALPKVAQHIAVTAMLIGSAEEIPLIDSIVTAEASRLVMTTVELDGRWYRCSYGRGYCRQTAYVCRTCIEEGRADPQHALCLACSEICHAGHEVEEWGVRYCMRCDCCTMKCWKTPPLINENNEDNTQNDTNANVNSTDINNANVKDNDNSTFPCVSSNNKNNSSRDASEHSNSARSSASMQLERISNVQTSDVRRRMQRKRSRSTSPLLTKHVNPTITTINNNNSSNINNNNNNKLELLPSSTSYLNEQDNKTLPLSALQSHSSMTQSCSSPLTVSHELHDGELREADSAFLSPPPPPPPPSSSSSSSSLLFAVPSSDNASLLATHEERDGRELKELHNKCLPEEEEEQEQQQQKLQEDVKNLEDKSQVQASITHVQANCDVDNNNNNSNNNNNNSNNMLDEQTSHSRHSNDNISTNTLDQYNNMYHVISTSRNKKVTRCLFVLDSDTNQPPTSALLPINHKNTYPRHPFTWCYCKDDHPSDDPECGGICCMLCSSCYWSVHITRLFTDAFRRVPCYGDVVYGDTIAFKCHTCNCYVCPACRYRCHKDHTCEDCPIIPSAHDGNDYGAPPGVVFSCGCHGMCSIATSVPAEEMDDMNTYSLLPNAVALEMMNNDVFSGFICAYCMQEYPWLMYNDPLTCYHGQLPAKMAPEHILPVIQCGDTVLDSEVPPHTFPYHGMLFPVTAFTEEMTCKCADCRAAYEQFAPRAEQEATEMVVELHDECDNCQRSIKDQTAYMCATCENEGKTFFICSKCNDIRLRLITGLNTEPSATTTTSLLAPISAPSSLQNLSSANTRNNRTETASTDVNTSTSIVNNDSNTNTNNDDITPEMNVTGERREQEQKQESEEEQETETNTTAASNASTFKHDLNHVFLADTLDNLYTICGMQVMQSLDEETRNEVVENWDSSSQQHVITDTIVNTFGQVPIEFTPEEKKEFTVINSKTVSGRVSGTRETQQQQQRQQSASPESTQHNDRQAHNDENKKV